MLGGGCKQGESANRGREEGGGEGWKSLLSARSTAREGGGVLLHPSGYTWRERGHPRAGVPAEHVLPAKWDRWAGESRDVGWAAQVPSLGGGDWTHPHRRNRRAHAHDEGRRATQPPPPVRGRAEKRACRPSRRHHTNGASGAPPKRHIPTQASSSSGSPPTPPPEPPTHATPSPSHTNSARRVPPPGRATAYRRPAAPCATQKATRRASVDGPPSRPSASRSQRGLGSHPPPPSPLSPPKAILLAAAGHLVGSPAVCCPRPGGGPPSFPGACAGGRHADRRGDARRLFATPAARTNQSERETVGDRDALPHTLVRWNMYLSQLHMWKTHS